MYNDDLFDDEALDKKSSYEEKTSGRGQDGLYRIDMDKVSPDNKNIGYKAKLRFLPNLTDNIDYVKAILGDRWDEERTTALGPSHYEKITHYVNIQAESHSHLKGYYDDPTNVNPNTQRPYTTEKWGPLAKLYFTLSKSNNAQVKAKANAIQYSKKYFSYVLVMEDVQQPELEGKIMIFSYGKQIKDIIENEEKGAMTGIPCNIFKLNVGKDFTLLAKNKSFTDKSGKEVTAPDYTMSRFNQDSSSISLPKKDGSGFVQIPLEEGNKIIPDHQEKIRKFLLSREVELESFAGQGWDETTEDKVKQLEDYLTGKSSGGSTAESEVDDFSFDEIADKEPVAASIDDDDDDDFSDLDF